MKLDVARIIVFAKDIKKMAAFYGETIGFARVVTEDDPTEFLTFDAGTVQLCLHRVPERYARNIEIQDPPVTREATPIKVVFRASDVAAARAELVLRGARMDPVKAFGALRLCDGVDLEGNVFQISNRA